MAQLRLDQLGCYVGPIDGVWSHNAQASLAALNNALGQKYVVEVPDEDLLKALNDADPRVCRRNGRHATQDPAARHGPANGDHAVTPAVTVDLLPAPPQALQLTQPLSQPQSIAPPGQGEPDRTAAATRSDGEPGGQAATAGKAEINAGKQDVSGSIARGEQRRNAKSGGAAPARSSRKEADVFGTLGGQAH